MNPMPHIVARVYTFLLLAYPSSFRAEFGDEMRGVFDDAFREATVRGDPAWVGFLLRELRDWLKTLLAEHWHSIRQYGQGRLAARSDGSNMFHEICWRYFMSMIEPAHDLDALGERETILAALPPLLFGLGVTANVIILGGPWHAAPKWRFFLSIAAVLVPAAVVAVGGLIALVRSLPGWGYTWLGSCLAGLILMANVIGEELAESGYDPIPPGAEMVIGILLMLTLFAGLAVAALRGWQQAGLASIGLASTLAISLCAAVASPPFHRRDLALLAAPVGLLVAALIYLYIHRSSTTQILVIVGTGLLNVALALMAAHAWSEWLVARGRPSPVLPLLLVMTGLLLAGPVIGLFVRPIRHRLGRA